MNCKWLSGVTGVTLTSDVFKFFVLDYLGHAACSMAQVAKKASASGDFVPQSPHQSFANGPNWHTRETSEVPIPLFPLAALSGNECLCFRLCFSNNVSEAWIHGWMSGLTLAKLLLVPICLYCLKFTKFGQFFLRKIIEIGATKCQILG